MMEIPYSFWRERFSPIIEVRVGKDDKKIRTLAYVDTGATYSIFNSEFAEELGIDILTGERVDITVGDGGMIPVYLHEMKVEIDKLVIAGKIGFSPRLGTGINIIGRRDLLDRYKVCFDGPGKKIIWHT